MSYIRFHMPLYNESSGYDFKGRKPTGRCLLEQKNTCAKLSLWVQDLRPQTMYKAYLIFPAGNKYAGISIATVSADERGKIEKRCEIHRDQLLGSVINDVVAMAIIHNENGSFNAPLCGYRNEKVSWITSFYEKKSEPEPTPEPVVEFEPVIEAEPTVEPEPVIELEPTVEPEPVVELELEPVVEPEPTVESEPESALSPPAHFTEPPNFSTLPLMTPFARGINDGIQWVRCTTAHKIIPPVTHPNLFNEPFVTASYEEYSHFILGEITEEDITEYIIGIPGVFSVEEQKKAELIGFEEFRCYEDIPPVDGEFGYWLLFAN